MVHQAPLTLFVEGQNGAVNCRVRLLEHAHHHVDETNQVKRRSTVRVKQREHLAAVRRTKPANAAYHRLLEGQVQSQGLQHVVPGQSSALHLKSALDHRECNEDFPHLFQALDHLQSEAGFGVGVDTEAPALECTGSKVLGGHNIQRACIQRIDRDGIRSEQVGMTDSYAVVRSFTERGSVLTGAQTADLALKKFSLVAERKAQAGLAVDELRFTATKKVLLPCTLGVPS